MSLLIRNGLLVDPANGLCRKMNLLVENGKIAQLTTDEPVAHHVIDADGCIVCPGFIDIHMHEDPVDSDESIRCDVFNSMLRMGVTTAVGGNCGDNEYDPAVYLDIVDRDGVPVNVALFAGHGYFRKKAGGLDKYAPITRKQQENMRAGLENALQAGCMGVSFGLRYVSGTDADEFRMAAGVCTAFGRLIAAHVRDDAAHVFSAVDEVARMGVECRVPVQISHIGSMGGFGQMQQLLRQIENYRKNGLDIACDCYPYEAFSTGIGETTYDEGWLDRYHCDYSACVPAEGRYKGIPCTKESFEWLRQEHPQCITVCYVMRGEDVRMALQHPHVMVASDGFINNGQGHPRAAGTFPRYFREYVKDGDLLSGIARMTSMPAERLGLQAKGRLNVGADADIVIFNPEELRDRATFDEPSLPPEGIDYVLIGGEMAIQKGKIINGTLGRAVRKT